MQVRRLRQGTDGRLQPRRLRDHGVTAGKPAVSRKGLVVVLAVACISVAHGRVGAYRFFPEGIFIEREGRLIVGSEDAPRWSPDVWGPGETLVWEIAPDLEVVYRETGVLPLVESALAVWSDLPSAAISWRVSGVGDEVDEAAGIDADTDSKKDGRNTIFLNIARPGGGLADVWDKRSSNGWEVTECDVGFLRNIWDAYEALWLKPSEDLDPEDLEMRRNSFRASHARDLAHDFGHCLGLHHPAMLSVVGREVSLFGSRRLIHPLDPRMSYGRRPEALKDLALTHDDVVGASLLRPADGWKRTTGSISGVLDLPGEEAARYAYVWALPVDGDPLRDRVGAFTNRVGAFLIEGLRPGNYALWAQPAISPRAHVHQLSGYPVFDLQDTVLGRPVRVRAGRTTGGVEIPVRRGRRARPPPEAVRTPRHSDPGTPINNRWGSTCSGVRIRGEPPFAADGPLWFTQGNWELRGERWFATRLTVEWSPEAGNAVFDWAGPWRDWYGYGDGAEAKSFAGESRLYLDISISDYRIEASGPVTRHTMDIAWPETTEARLRFRSEDGACDGEPTVVCSLAGCGITE